MINYPDITCSSVQDTESYHYWLLTPTLIDCELPESNWNDCNNCSISYCIPYITGDTFTIQFRPVISIGEDDTIVLNVYDANGEYVATTDIGDVIFGYFVKNGISYFNVKIDMAFIANKYNIDCFSIQIKLVGEFGQQVLDDLIPFCLAKCNQPTLVIESEYPNVDCLGNIYGGESFLGDETAIFTNAIRIAAVIEYVDNVIEKDFSADTDDLSMTWSRLYRLRAISNIGNHAAKVIANIIAGKNVLVDGERFIVKKGFDRKNEASTDWFPQIELIQQCNKNLNC